MSCNHNLKYSLTELESLNKKLDLQTVFGMIKREIDLLWFCE